MATRQSLACKNSENWLLSYTDLFLLVLSFFVLRFSILKYEIKPSNTHLIESNTAISKPEHSLVFKVATVEQKAASIAIQTSIGQDWFSESGLSSRGEREMHYLGKKIETSNKTATMTLPIVKGLETIERNKQISLIVQNLKGLGLRSIKIELALRQSETCGSTVNDHRLACLSLDY